MKADALKILALHWLRKQHADATLLCEMGLGSWSSGGRLDVAAITDSEIIAVEIKGDGDSPTRLPLQAERYAAVCSRVWLLPSPDLRKGCERHRPLGWGMLEVINGAVQQADRYGSPSDLGARNSAGVMWSMLWSAEMGHTYRRLAVAHAGKLSLAGHHCREGGERIPLHILRPAVIGALRARDWRRDGQFPKGAVWLPTENLPNIDAPAAKMAE